MRFITEFELDGNINTDLLPHIIPDKKHIRELGIGQEIGKSFGWNQLPIISMMGPHAIKWSLEIEAFPMSQWIEFKKELLAEFEGSYIDVERMRERIEKLESFGKPAAENSLLDSDIQYRGPNSHCKACEDERSGKKHITAPKHTCGK